MHKQNFVQHVLDKLEVALAAKLRNRLQDPRERQMVFQLLGQHFVQRYFRDYPNQPSLLSSPNLSSIVRKKVQEDTWVWLQEQRSQAAISLHCQLQSDGDMEGLAPEMLSFVNDTYSLVTTEMERHLATLEAKRKVLDLTEDQITTAWFSSCTVLTRKRPKSVESQNNICPKLSFPALNCPDSDILGESLCAILSSDHECWPAVFERLSGKLLPQTLRRFIWIEKLLKCEKKMKRTNVRRSVEKEVREKFGRTVAHRLAELKLRSATRSPISGLIENAVVEVYENTPCMHLFATNEHMILETSKTLNVLYVHNGTYKPYLIHWLFPLQMALKQNMPTAEHPYELAMYLHFLIQHLFPSWLEIFAMAERVMNLLEIEDNELFAHLQHSVKKQVTFDPKDFLVEMTSQKRGEAQKVHTTSDGMDLPHSLGEELTPSPIIFLRKWMGEGFVGIVDLPAVWLIWDQLFMQDWNQKVMENFCVAILMLLKNSFMAANDYYSIRQVFLFHGYHLLTADIQRAWIHLQQGGLAADIPGFNRLNERRRFSLASVLPEVSVGSRQILPVGVKDVLLNLVLPVSSAEKSYEQTWLNEFDPLAVKLRVSVFYGCVKLRSKMGSFQPSLLTKNKGKATAMTLNFNETWTFNTLDPSEFTDVAPTDANPFMVLTVIYSRGANDSLTLGWTKVEAFKEETIVTRGAWAPRETTLHLLLHPGKEPYNIVDHSIGYSIKGSHPHEESSLSLSNVHLTVFDPLKEEERERSTQVRDERGLDQELPFPYASWIPHNDLTVLPDSTRVDHPFDLYIDALHYIPDNATITKVTGQLINSGLDNLPDIIAFPVLNSSFRNPKFQYCMAINLDNPKAMNSNTFLLLQVSTVDYDSAEVVVLGNCMIRVFDEEGKLNVGGFQLPLRFEMPSKKSRSLTPSAFDHCPALSCCTLLIRLLPHTQDPVPAPSYLTGYYFSSDAKPTKSELQIMSTFERDSSFPKHVQDMSKQLMDKEQSRVPPDQLQDWYKERLNASNHSAAQHTPQSINIHHLVRYRQESGIRLRIAQAFGLDVDGLYINAFARILKGTSSMHLPELPGRWRGDEKFLTRQHDFSSLLKSPRWTDPSVVLHPYLDEHSVLLVQLFGIDAVYIPDPSGQRVGIVTSRSGQDVELYTQTQLGWTAVPLFDRQYVKSGIHSAPLFQGVPSASSAIQSVPQQERHQCFYSKYFLIPEKTGDLCCILDFRNLNLLLHREEF
ncbi:uncharacterized protein LOC115482380 [Microcaecilia unicolor]|uniref:Uncharacterized protein LOC115482380 n=1 Tax=Microcaecilia unicolor TaxID=1415580 RepID=A0A6P7ZF76_9AMPH|nr:uncharacterized protein LOC115482380 [Microcaecilia unicolor]